MDGDKQGGEYQEDLTENLICRNCREDPPNLIEEAAAGDIVCTSCGTVLQGHVVDLGSEWRTFSNDDQGNDDPSRVGQAPDELFDGDQLVTTIGYNANNRSKAARALTKAQQSMNNDKNAKALMAAYRDIATLCETLNAGQQVASSAKQIYKQVDDAKFLRGKSQEAIIAGCIFVSCRKLNVARTFREIFSLTSVPKKEIGRVFKSLENFLGKSAETKTTPGTSGKYEATKATKASDLIVRYCNLLRFRNNSRIENVARALAEEKIEALAGRSPLSVAAACIYMACHLMGEPRSLKDAGNIAGVSDGTVKTAYRFLYAVKDEIVKPAWLADGGKMENLPAN
ncbi:hypothetical protein P8C59_006039 [Phyllachora maydis]|uniref:Transcription initiation factor IIB n=1 Tax=Phyllachora maydis TaxID=1825666 RepID=A0AAD9I5Q0_9PEZI|nr:hypothetical protein P8C59_006039 [Phyllachora maydis]